VPTIGECAATSGSPQSARIALAQQPVTVGSASTRWLDLVIGLGLDFLPAALVRQVRGRNPLATPVSALACDRPVVLGEFPTNNSAHPPERLLATARQAGYHGALFWSVFADDTANRFHVRADGSRGVERRRRRYIPRMNDRAEL
jgi:hypothetical protein